MRNRSITFVSKELTLGEDTKNPWLPRRFIINSLPEPVLIKIKSVFRDLSDDDLHRKRLHGHTQNPNESFNHVIWTTIPKEVFVGYNTLETGVMDAVVTFNGGAMGRAAVFRKLNLDIGRNTQTGLRVIDRTRVRKADKRRKT